MLFIYVLSCLLCFSSGYVHYNNELSTEISRIWDLDQKCVPGVDYKLDLQGYVSNLNWNGRDWARRKLFKNFNEATIFSKPTYKAFKDLLDNFNADTSSHESHSAAERREINNFLDLIIRTNVIKEVHRFLVRKRKVHGSITAFKTTLNNLWFKIYKRLRTDSRPNSCGFEHVFVGERRHNEVTGFHNWLQLYLQEKAGHVDYRGYFRRGTTDELETHPRLMTLQFSWNRNYGKALGSIFVGTSPEFEIGIFTLVHLMRFHTPPSVRIKNYPVQLIVRGHGHQIGTAYPKSLSN